MELQKRVNTYDLLTYSMDGGDTRKTLFVKDALIEVWRRVQDGSSPWYRESTLMHRTPSRQITERGTRIFTSYSRGLLDLLHRREILYRAGTTFTLKGGPADTVMKAYVNENAGPGANNAARVADGVTTGFTVEPAAGIAPEWAGQRSWQNLLDVLQEIAADSGVDFDVVRTDTPGSGAAAFEFRTYYPQLGTDRSATVHFATKFNNMQSPYYTNSSTEQVTRVAALGPGENTARRVIVEENAAGIAESPWNTIERSQDARQEDTLTGLQSAATAVLAQAIPQEQFTFQIMQTDALQYGRDYFLGDIVTASFDDDITTTKKIVGVTINVSEGKEVVSCEFADVPTFA